MESKIQHRRTGLRNRNRITDVEHNGGCQGGGDGGRGRVGV